MNKWLWLALIPSLAFSAPRTCNMRQDPVYVDVHPDKVILCVENMEIAANELTGPESAFERFLQNVELVRESRYIVLILRPGSAPLQQQLRQIVKAHNIDFGIELWEAGREFPDNMAEMHSRNPLLPTAPPSNLFELYKEKVAGDFPCEVEVNEDSLTILKDHVIVTSNQLATPGNSFEQLVDQREAEGGFPPVIIFCKGTGGDQLFLKLMFIIQKRAPKMAWIMGISPPQQVTVLLVTPLEAQAEGKQPVVIECRRNLLFSPDSSDHEIEGYSFDSPFDETDDTWLGSQLAKLDPEKQYVLFRVHPDSFNIFRKAREVAWKYRLESSCELLDDADPLLTPEISVPQQNEDFEQSGPGYPPQGVGSPDP